ncbi:MAG: carbohydrate ABC transporter permease [Planctomycetota bacterium]|nr:MAG: carbohydrate ABC transporter permease [Planctomycetota bacterium]
MNPERGFARWSHRALLLALAAAFVLPFLWLISASLQPEGKALGRGLFAFPDGVHLENYPTALQIMGDPKVLIFNTVVLTLACVLGQLFCCSLAGYAFARLRFRGRDTLFLLVLATMMLPPQVLAIPQFLLFKEFGLIDTFGPLILPTVLGGAPFFIFLFRQYFLTIPHELAEAARMDGCGFFATYWKVMLPLARPVVGTVAVFTFLATWNDFWAPLIYLNSEDKQTLTLALATFNQTYRIAVEWLMAGTAVVLAPCVLVYFLSQKFFLRGVRLSAGKG